MYEPGRPNLAMLALLWPAIAAGSVSDMAAAVAKQFVGLAVGAERPVAPEPPWATAHVIALELQTARLRDFSKDTKGPAALLCAPLAIHSAAIVDFASHHSLVAALRQAGLGHLFVADWRSATPEMRYLGIDDYLASLNVMVDEIGAPVNLIGVCQGGWMALVYATRFPKKVRKLVLAGAPIDIVAAPSSLSSLAGSTPLEVFRELVRLGDGVVPGRKLQTFWGPDLVHSDYIRQVLQTDANDDSAGLDRLEARFREWYAWAIDLPGTFFLEVVERLYKRNELATGAFTALGRENRLSTMCAPVFMLAARDDELVVPSQLFAVESLVGTAAHNLRRAIVPCGHAGLFTGKQTLERTWSKIAHWLAEPQEGAARFRKASAE